MNLTLVRYRSCWLSYLATQVPTLLAGIAALLFVPQVAKAALLIWLGEYIRSQRVVAGSNSLETWINDVIGAEAIGREESWPKKSAGRGHMHYPYIATVSLILDAGLKLSSPGRRRAGSRSPPPENTATPRT
jgi:hypothetical protein